MAAAAAEPTSEDHSVELVVCDSSASADGGISASEEITPLLTQPMRPKINIFSVTYSRRKPREPVTMVLETEISPVTQFVQWVWSGSRYSGLLCMALSSALYFAMEVLSDAFSDQAIPLYEIALTRCTIILVLSFLWLRRCRQPIFGPAHARKLLFSRAFVGCLSMFSFVYSIQILPLSQAIVLNFTTPIMASIVARIVLHERLKISDIGGLACSFFGVLFIFRQILTPQGGLFTNGAATNAHVKGSHHILAVLVGLFSAIAGGISYCLIKAGAKASDQPIVTVLFFSILASPAAGLCTFAFEEFVMPGICSVFLMVVLGGLAFLAEVLVARGLQLEKTSKVVNVLYIEAVLAQLWHIGSSSMAPTFGQLIGCILIVISVSCTMYIGPDKEIE